MELDATLSDGEFESFAQFGESGTYRAEFDRENTAASTAVVGALSEVTGTDPTELEPLYASIETDALDELLGPRTSSTGEVSVSFPVQDYEITVDSRGVVIVEPQASLASDPGVGGPMI